MRSMTGYGRGSASVDRLALRVRISSVNRRSLEISVSLPEGWEALEPAVAERVRRHALRGKVHVDIEAEAETAGGAEWDDDEVRLILRRLAALAQTEGVVFRPDASLLWQVASTRRLASGLPDVEAAQPPVLEAVEGALREFAAMRAKEGEALLIDFLARLTALRRGLETIAARAPQVAPAYRELLLRRLREAGLELDVSDERVLKEVALFADRCDISEETVRFRSHLDQLAGLLREEGEIGRKAEFLLQELGREAHTMGSKANDLVISKQVIELRNELERVREQMANVE